jgi:hypothetical protein
MTIENEIDAGTDVPVSIGEPVKVDELLVNWSCEQPKFR